MTPCKRTLVGAPLERASSEKNVASEASPQDACLMCETVQHENAGSFVFLKKIEIQNNGRTLNIGPF